MMIYFIVKSGDRQNEIKKDNLCPPDNCPDVLPVLSLNDYQFIVSEIWL